MERTYITIAIMAVCLVLFHIIFHFAKVLKPNKDFSSIVVRVKTWWGMLVVFSIATIFNPLVSVISLAILCFFSLREYFSMMKSRKADRRIFLWAYFSIPIQFYWISIGWYGMFIVFIPVYVFLFLPIPRIIGRGTVGFLHTVSFVQWGLMLMVFGLSHLAFFQTASPEYGPNLVLFLVLLTQMNDAVQYFVSIFWGKRKLVPSANPHITWEGFFCSMFITTFLSYLIYPYLTPLDLTFGILSGVLISGSAFIGILTISVLKRDLLIGDKQKFDSLKGSFLNRIDSLTYTSPIIFHVVRYFFDFM